MILQVFKKYVPREYATEAFFCELVEHLTKTPPALDNRGLALRHGCPRGTRDRGFSASGEPRRPSCARSPHSTTIELMSESCSCASWEREGLHHVAGFPDTQFDTLAREDLGDYHGAVPHPGRLRCKTCGATFGYLSELSSTTVTRESDIDRVIAALREGKAAQVGGGRSFSTYVIRDGQAIMITSDDGYTEDVPIREEHLRDVVAAEPALFRDYLRIWQRPATRGL